MGSSVAGGAVGSEAVTVVSEPHAATNNAREMAQATILGTGRVMDPSLQSRCHASPRLVPHQATFEVSTPSQDLRWLDAESKAGWVPFRDSATTPPVIRAGGTTQGFLMRH